jgi:hypothetical protein
MDKIDKIVISLLALALIAAFIAGLLYIFVKSKTGPKGSNGVTGPTGIALPTIQSPLLQINTTSLPNTSTSVSQYTKTITVQATGHIADSVLPGSNVLVGIIPSNKINLPTNQIVAAGFLDNVLGMPVYIATNGEVSMHITQSGSLYSFNISYSVP